MKRLLVVLLMGVLGVGLFGQSLKPQPIPLPFNFLNYVLVQKYLHVGDSISCDSIRVGNKWLSNKTKFGEPLLGVPAANGYVLSSTTSGVRSWVEMTGGAGGVTPIDGIFKWDGTAYNPYPAIVGTSLMVSSQTAISHNNATDFFNINGHLVVGNDNTLNDKIGVSSYSYSSPGVYGNSYYSYGVQGSSNSGYGLYGTSGSGFGGVLSSNSNISCLINNGSGNTSNILEGRVGGISKFYFDKDGILAREGVYKLPSTAGTNGQVLTSSGTGNQFTWSSPVGTVTTLILNPVNGLSGTVTNPTSTPTISLVPDTINKFYSIRQSKIDSTKQYNQIISKLGLTATAVNSSLLQGRDSVYIKARWTLSNPMTTSGDIIYGGSSGVANKLGIGSAGQVLTSSSGLPIWASLPSPGNSFLYWNPTNYRYDLYADSTGTGAYGGMYLGTQDPTKATRININGVLHPTGLSVSASSGSSFFASNTGGIGVQGSTQSGYAVQGAASTTGTGGIFTAGSGNGVYATSTTGVSLRVNNTLGNTSDIFKGQVNAVDMFRVDKDGNAYKSSTDTFSTQAYVRAHAGSGGGGVTPQNGLLNWDGSAYNPYTSIGNTSLILSNVASPTSLYNSTSYLNLNGHLIAGNNHASNILDGIYGISRQGNGIKGESTSGNGVYGVSDQQSGVQGYSNTGPSLVGVSVSGIGLYLQNTSGNTSDLIRGTVGGTNKFRVDKDGIAYQSTTDTLATRSYSRTHSGTTLGDGLLKSTSTSFIPYTTISDTSLIFARTATVPSNNSLGYLTLNGQFKAGNTNAANNRIAIQGTSYGSYGIYGASVSGVGTYGISNSSTGVYGNSTTGIGVYGVSNQGEAIHGVSTASYGLWASSVNSYGVYATSGTSVSGVFNNGPSNTSDILQLKLAGSNMFRVDKDGIAYQSYTDTLSTRAYARARALGSVSTVSIVNSGGLKGTVATPTTTPAITLIADTINKFYSIRQSKIDSTKQYNQIQARVPKTTTVNGKALTGNISIGYSDLTVTSSDTISLGSVGFLLADSANTTTSRKVETRYHAATTYIPKVNPKIILSSPGFSLDANGTLFTGTAGESLVFGDLVYIKSDGKYWKARADVSTTVPVVGMALGSISANASANFLEKGIVRNDSWTWGTVGGQMWLSVVTGGLITQTKPSADGNQLIYIGYARSATEIYFNPSQLVIEITTP